MPRAILLILDSFGIGASLDAKNYGDEGADTLGHIADYCAQDKNGRGPLHIPHLNALGLDLAFCASTGKKLISTPNQKTRLGSYGYCVEKSLGKDTPSGHWEMMGLPVLYEWGYFKADYPSFPETLINDLVNGANLPGVLGNKHASGTQIIEEFGEEHKQSGKPIVYTSADSVLQIAAHEDTFGLNKLYALCEMARKLVDPYQIGRVIARPFLDNPEKNEAQQFIRTGNRKDYAMPPHGETLLDHLIAAGQKVIGIGKIADIFANQGISVSKKAHGNTAIFESTLDTMAHEKDNVFIFSNFVDFDSAYGHRRDILGYAKALEDFDKNLPRLLCQMQNDDLLLISADHGCDPSFPGSDHTREHVPVLMYQKNESSRFLGRRETFADIGQSIAKHMGIPALNEGNSFYCTVKDIIVESP